MTHVDPQPIPESPPEQPAEVETPGPPLEIDPGATPDELPPLDPGAVEMGDSMRSMNG